MLLLLNVPSSISVEKIMRDDANILVTVNNSDDDNNTDDGNNNNDTRMDTMTIMVLELKK